MRLLHAQEFVFKEFIGKNIPEYAIISHRWFDDEEVSYQDFLKGRLDFLDGRSSCNSYGWRKIAKAAELTWRHQIEWFWIDTCCIDKKSSAELSEAINSMFKWYQKSKVCFAFLPDVHGIELQMPPSDGLIYIHCNATRIGYYRFVSANALVKSLWFSRAWTLQELLAPRALYFLDSSFSKIATREDLTLRPLITEVTGISDQYLLPQKAGKSIQQASVAERMRWASRRVATREEDVAYSLLGIFGVNMPLLYGEGRRAFARLQSEIIRASNDESIFAWKFQHPIRRTGLLAYDIRCFSFAETMRQQVQDVRIPRCHYEKTNMGLRWTISVSAKQLADSLAAKGYATVFMPLNCGTRWQLPVVLELQLMRPKTSNSVPNMLWGQRINGAWCELTAGRSLFNPSVVPRPTSRGSTSSRKAESNNAELIVVGEGEDQTDVSVYFLDTVELNRGHDGIRAEEFSEMWGLPATFRSALETL